MPAFKKVYKKLHAKEKVVVNESIEALSKDPSMGEEKKGDLQGVFVYKFRVQRQEMLLAYEWDSKQLLLLDLGVHENFYRDLKR